MWRLLGLSGVRPDSLSLFEVFAVADFIEIYTFKDKIRTFG